MNILQKFEEEKGLHLPEIYKHFFQSCLTSVPNDLVGTDLFNNKNDLNEGAAELLAENGVQNFLEPNDFVFMMHQGYIFWYFKADGNQDPLVFSYHEADKKTKMLGPFSEFIKLYK